MRSRPTDVASRVLWRLWEPSPSATLVRLRCSQRTRSAALCTTHERRPSDQHPIRFTSASATPGCGGGSQVPKAVFEQRAE